MAKEPENEGGEEKEEAPVELDRVSILEKKLKTNRTILLVLGFTCLLFVSIVITGLVLLGREVTALPKDPLKDMESQIALLDQQQSALKLTITNHRREVKLMNSSIQSIDFSAHLKQVHRIEKVLLRQEKDYQYLLATMGKGVSSIANMLRGSKKWKSEYRNRIEKSMNESKRREEDIKALINPDVEDDPEY